MGTTDSGPIQASSSLSDCAYSGTRKILIATSSLREEALLNHLLVACGFACVPCTNELPDRLLPGDSEILLLDIAFARKYGEDLSSLVGERSHKPHILVLGHAVPESEKRSLLGLGVRGYLSVPKEIEFLRRAIMEISAGGLWFTRSVLAETILGARSKGWLLTPREKMVAACVNKGLRNREIANALGITEKTVKLHLTHVYDKLDVSNRAQLILALQRFL